MTKREEKQFISKDVGEKLITHRHTPYRRTSLDTVVGQDRISPTTDWIYRDRFPVYICVYRYTYVRDGVSSLYSLFSIIIYFFMLLFSPPRLTVVHIRIHTKYKRIRIYTQTYIK